MLTLCFVLDVEPGTTKGFDPSGAGYPTLFVLRLWDRVVVFRNRCPHTGSVMNLKVDQFLSPGGDSLMCYRHGARFDFHGRCVSGPCLGQSLQIIHSYVTETGYVTIDVNG